MGDSYGVRARLAWYWRRVQRRPVTRRFLQPPLGVLADVVDPQPRWRKPLRPALDTRLRHFVWSAQNYIEGYAWGPVQRWRCCGHTTPYHSPGCVSPGCVSHG
jgi:hypothetical protein